MAQTSHKKLNINLLIPFLLVALVFGFTIWQKYRSSRELPPVPHIQKPVGKRTAVLFFIADGTRLAREARELDSCDETNACLKEVLDELVNGPVGEFDGSLPDATVINSARIEVDTAVVDLNKGFAEALQSGSSAEMLAVYAIVNTVAANFPQISKVRLSIDGDVKAPLKHLDLSDPLVPDYTLEFSPFPKVDAPVKSKTKKGQP